MAILCLLSDCNSWKTLPFTTKLSTNFMPLETTPHAELCNYVLTLWTAWKPCEYVMTIMVLVPFTLGKKSICSNKWCNNVQLLLWLYVCKMWNKYMAVVQTIFLNSRFDGDNWWTVCIHQRDAQILVNRLYFLVKWLCMFRTIISPSSGATFN